MLMPAAILIVLVLGAIAVDMSVVHLAKRELIDAAAAAANDAVTIGMDEEALRNGAGFTVDPQRAMHAAEQSLEAAGLLDRLAEAPEITVTDDDRVQVHLVIEVDYIFAKALPGNDGHTIVHARASAMASQR